MFYADRRLRHVSHSIKCLSFVAPLRFRIFRQDNGVETVPNQAFYVKKMFVARFGGLYRHEIMQINRLQANLLLQRGYLTRRERA